METIIDALKKDFENTLKEQKEKSWEEINKLFELPQALHNDVFYESLEELKQETIEEAASKWSLEEAQKFALSKLKKQFQMKADEALELNSKIGNFGKEEPKQKTLEEAAEWFSDDEPNCDYEAGIKTGKYQGFVEGAKYMQKRMYSEEDMREAIRFGLYGMYGYTCGKEGETDNQINKYLKQFKKE
jgi:hypothetical protein